MPYYQLSWFSALLQRSRAAVDKNVKLLESVEIVRSEYVVNPGHGKRKVIKATDKYLVKLHVEAMI